MKIITLLIIVFFQIECLSQEFEGVINFEVSHEFLDSTLFSEIHLPNEMTYTISGEYARLDQSTVLGNQSIIKDTLSKKSILILKIMDDNVGIELENELDTNEVKEVTYSNDSKEILDFLCKKAVINTYNKITEKNSTTILYYTDEISNVYSNNFENLKGFPLSYEISSDNITSKYIATNIRSKNIDPQLFVIGKNTRTFSLEEFKSLMNK